MQEYLLPFYLYVFQIQNKVPPFCHKLHPDGTQDKKEWRINPEQSIPPEVTAVHGITNEMVANEATFKERSNEIYSLSLIHISEPTRPY